MLFGILILIAFIAYIIVFKFRLFKITKLHLQQRCFYCSKERVMFSPDTQKPCKSFIDGLKSGKQIRCPRRSFPIYRTCDYYHGDNKEKPCALAEVIKTLNTAKKSIYLCMFSFTNDTLSDFLVYLRYHRHISVKILTDSRFGENQNDQVAGLKRAGFSVRVIKEGSMHNKYCIIDNKILLSGSTNWTHTGFGSNNEMIMWTENPAIVDKVSRKFESLYSGGG